MTKTTSPRCATAKAKLLRDALRCATSCGASAQAQAVLATLIAESWPTKLTDGTTGWVATIGYPMLHRRLNTSIPSVRRWCAELVDLNLVIKHPGDGRNITRWLIRRRPPQPTTPSRVLTSEHPGCSPTSRGVLTSEHPG